MKRLLVLPVVLVGAIVLAIAALARPRPPAKPAPTPEPVAAKAPSPFETVVRPFLADYCIKCHQGEKAQAGIDFARIQDDRDAMAAGKTWRKAWEKVRTRVMPPPERPQPSTDDRERILRWMETTINGPGARDPGRVVMRRLTKVEYRNTIRDLVGIDFKAADDFPADDIGYGFDNIGDVLTLPPILMERYLDAAGKVLDKAIVTEEQRKPATRSFKGSQLAGQGGGGVRGDRFELWSEGEASCDVRVRLEADYEIRAQAGADQAGPDPARMSLRVNGEQAALVDVKAPRGSPETYSARVRMKPGQHRLAAAFTNDYYQPQNPDPAQRDRNLVLFGLELVGPIGAAPPATHTRLFIAAPSKELPAKEAARNVLTAFADRAWRRATTPAEIDRLLTLFDKAAAQGDSFEQAMKLPLKAVLVSPHFLFRIEPDLGPSKGVRDVTDDELAVRLSYFLWSSMPDDELLAVARAGKLRNAATLEAQTRRMLRDVRATALADNFATQWLQLRRLDKLAPDPVIFPQFDEELRAAMGQEAALFFESVLREERSAMELIGSDYTFVNERLARHYGIEGVTGAQMRRVRLPDARRGGVATMAAVLATTSMATRTSPPKRGKWVLETLLGTPPPPPLPDAGTLKDAKEAGAAPTMRERLKQHRANPKCAPCHLGMDAIGFGLENYDALGAWRERDAGLPLDTSGTLPDGRSFKGPAELKSLLLAQEADVAGCVAEKLMIYALGRGIEPCDGEDLRAIVRNAANDGFRLSTLVLEVVKSYAFLHRRNSSEGTDE